MIRQTSKTKLFTWASDFELFI